MASKSERCRVVVTTPDAISAASQRPEAITLRMALASQVATVFDDVGTNLHVIGHIAGTDRRDGVSPFGHGDDEVVAISMLLRIASQLVSGSTDLIAGGRGYAGAALVRQLVEIEYLAWAFESDPVEAARWLRSDKKERQSFFTPAKLRAAGGGRFRSADYGHHCELGGHPTPAAWALLNKDTPAAQIMLADCLGHAERVWQYVVGWAATRREAEVVLLHRADLSTRYDGWRTADPLASLTLSDGSAG